jgi:nucleoside-diphosphate-sugar epimerase
MPGNDKKHSVFITGGCGYVGTILIPKLAKKHDVTVLDVQWFGNFLPPLPNVKVVKGDIRDYPMVKSLLAGKTDVIHLASIANDPTSDLNPAVTYQVNRDAVRELAKMAKEAGVRKMINASSSSVYGVKEEEKVTEDLPLEPITLYAKLKAETERIINEYADKDFAPVSIRSATVCGPSRRMRFDLVVNIMAKAAIVDRMMTVFGGNQHRPNIHIEDLTDLYSMLVDVPAEKLNGKIYNVGSVNHTVLELAKMAQEETGAQIKVDSNTTDNRSYRITSEKIKKELGYEPARSIRQAIKDLKTAFDNKLFGDPNQSKYYNIRTMKELMAK